MRSPFPGMDPYLEGEWGDVHASLCTSIRDAIQPQLPSDLRARTERRVLLEDDRHAANTLYIPDVTVLRSVVDRHAATPAGTGGSVTLAPVIIEEIVDAPMDRWVQVIDVKNGNRVVTAIEILSPGNKRSGELNDDYRRKIEDYLRGGVNVVELDLLRGRRHKLRVRHEDLPPNRAAEYLYCVQRSDRRRRWYAYPMRLRDRLPVVPVPLRPEDADVTLDLQALIDHAYLAGGHDDIDYTKPADPPLSPDDAAWLAGLLATRSAEGTPHA